ncbi:MAG: hypothetical protein ACR5K9_04520 [Wolbachia sp.]
MQGIRHHNSFISCHNVCTATVVLYPLSLLINKAIECFSPDENKQPDSLVDNAEVDGANADHRVPSPSH